MSSDAATCWILIRGAAAGDGAARSQFVGRYLEVVRKYLAARWSSTPLAERIDDAVQDVFLDCFKEDGVLERTDPERGFRAYLFGVVRTAALRFESRWAREIARQTRSEFPPEQVVCNEESLSVLFDRTWAQAQLREAARRTIALGKERGGVYEQRAELLRLRFTEELPIREIARLWGMDPARVHHLYADAREDFRSQLSEVVGLHEGCSRERIDEECSRLIAVLGRDP